MVKLKPIAQKQFVIKQIVSLGEEFFQFLE